jgi:tRNA nucleotidyltransferase (CCA-adding enzyme)
MDPKSFFPPELYSLLFEIEQLGFSLCLVGGAVRDFLLNGELSQDLDFEIRSTQTNISNITWTHEYQKLVNFLQNKKLKIISHPYLITKVEFLKWSLEFSSPRIEVFTLLNSHHNFDAILSRDINYDESFKRRDFTINAIGFEISFKNNLITKIDPYNGENHLHEKNLSAINEDFFKDSVRFLRLIRFLVKYKFSLDKTIEQNIGKFNLSLLSKFHFTSELLKSRPGEFLLTFRKLVQHYTLILPPEFNVWLDQDLQWPLENISSKDDLLLFVFLNKPASAVLIQRFFSLPVKSLEDYKVFYSSLLYLKNIKKDDLNKLLALNMNEALSHDFFKNMKILDEKKNLRFSYFKFLPKIEATLIFSWNDWENILPTTNEISECPTKFRSNLKYYLALKKWMNK